MYSIAGKINLRQKVAGKGHLPTLPNSGYQIIDFNSMLSFFHSVG